MDTKGNILMNKYEIGRLLGQGAFAKVYYGKQISTGLSVAIKVIDKEKVSKVGIFDQIEREVYVMKLLKHQNVTQIYEVMATKTKIYFVIEYAKGGELRNKIAKRKLKETTYRKYFRQLIFAVQFCHSRGVYHRDLKLENLLLSEDGSLKVSDFGLSALTESKCQDGLLHTACGTPAYVAPEVISRKGYDGAKADIWSCGVILYVLLAGHLPFKGSNIMEMYRKISKAEYEFPEAFCPQVRRLLSKILDPNPQTRISMDRIIKSSWFQKGLDSKPKKNEAFDIDSPQTNIDIVSHLDNTSETTMQLPKPAALNAFEIISLSSGFNLSGFFVTNELKDEVQFMSTVSTSAIVSKLEEIAGALRLKVRKNQQVLLRIERCNKAGKVCLSIDVEMFEVSPSFHLVELKKSCGDTVEYQNMLKQDMRPALSERASLRSVYISMG